MRKGWEYGGWRVGENEKGWAHKKKKKVSSCVIGFYNPIYTIGHIRVKEKNKKEAEEE